MTSVKCILSISDGGRYQFFEDFHLSGRNKLRLDQPALLRTKTPFGHPANQINQGEAAACRCNISLHYQGRVLNISPHLQQPGFGCRVGCQFLSLQQTQFMQYE